MSSLLFVYFLLISLASHVLARYAVESFQCLFVYAIVDAQTGVIKEEYVPLPMKVDTVFVIWALLVRTAVNVSECPLAGLPSNFIQGCVLQIIILLAWNCSQNEELFDSKREVSVVF